MPTLSISSDIEAATEIQLVMLHPQDEEVRERNRMLWRWMALTQDNDDPRTLTGNQIQALLRAPSWDEIKKHEQDCTKRGFLAGRLLATIYFCHRFKDRHHYFVPSINRAMHVCVAQARQGARFGDGSPMPTSDRTIRNAWLEYACVAPFWAALSMSGLGYPFAPEREILLPQYLPTFLGVVAGLHRFGTTFVPERALPRVPILDPTTTWAPPVGTVPADLVSDRLPNVLKSLLQAYRAPK